MQTWWRKYTYIFSRLSKLVIEFFNSSFRVWLTKLCVNSSQTTVITQNSLVLSYCSSIWSSQWRARIIFAKIRHSKYNGWVQILTYICKIKKKPYTNICWIFNVDDQSHTHWEFQIATNSSAVQCYPKLLLNFHTRTHQITSECKVATENTHTWYEFAIIYRVLHQYNIFTVSRLALITTCRHVYRPIAIFPHQIIIIMAIDSAAQRYCMKL